MNTSDSPQHHWASPDKPAQCEARRSSTAEVMEAKLRELSAKHDKLWADINKRCDDAEAAAKYWQEQYAKARKNADKLRTAIQRQSSMYLDLIEASV